MTKINKINTILHESAGGVILYNNKNNLLTAVLKKDSGRWVLPKGHIKIKESPMSAAVREISEELKFRGKLQFINKLRINKYKFKTNGNLNNFKKVYRFVFLTDKKYKLSPLKKEGFVRAVWLPVKKVNRLLAHESEGAAVIEAVKKYNLWLKK